MYTNKSFTNKLFTNFIGLIWTDKEEVKTYKPSNAKL